MDLENKSEEFLSVSLTGKLPVVVADSDPLYESNVVNQYIDETVAEPKLLPEVPKERAYACIWMARADDDFFPPVFIASAGRERGSSEEQLFGPLKKLETAFGVLKGRLGGREYLADEFSLADIAYAGNFVRLRELAEGGEIGLDNYPNIVVRKERVEARERFKAAR